ncbi:MAG TPA: ABC transporter ATP-binding protein [Thermomicrobiales bacterium]|nr:ABC transporter ATP-binding protein [Thermomicrobiales bacterium]
MLTLEDVRISYGAIQAVKGISLNVGERELVALVGSNGAGKTTTLRTISGIFRPRTGRIVYEGRDLTKLAPHQIVAAGVVQAPEGRQIFGSLTVRENLMLGAVSRRDRAAIPADLERVFDLFPVLKERLGQAGGTLSGGEQQMLSIGRALMARPRLLLLDEPSLGLAPLIVARIFDVIARLKAEGVTILLVEQNARKALEVADRAYVLETGLVALSGSARELAANPEIERAYLGG